MPMRILAILALLALAACNTVEGAGKDISTAGQAEGLLLAEAA